ncbi:MAG: serine--tRNA ligase, partial [Firmicutes bacterium]|nr:serine--tRNA ligase [Bacillota bacterium]
MLDLRLIRKDPDLVRKSLRNRGEDTAPLDEVLTLDEEHRKLLAEVEELRAQRNKASQEIAAYKRQGQDPGELMEQMREVSDRIKELEGEIRELSDRINGLLLRMPNIPHSSVPIGPTEAENVEVRRWGEPRQFDFEPKPHWDLGAELGILDFERAGKVTGARFVFLKGLGARLERAVINFMLDLHTKEHGYTEIFPPFLANEASMIGTGQLPKFGE